MERVIKHTNTQTSFPRLIHFDTALAVVQNPDHYSTAHAQYISVFRTDYQAHTSYLLVVRGRLLISSPTVSTSLQALPHHIHLPIRFKFFRSGRILRVARSVPHQPKPKTLLPSQSSFFRLPAYGSSLPTTATLSLRAETRRL